MSGKILQAARRDFERISSTGGFEEDIEIYNPKNNTRASFKNLHTKHYLGFDTEGSRVNSKSAHVTIIQKVLEAQDYVFRNERTGEIDLKGHRIVVADSSSLKDYVINEWYPSDTFGVIVCILGDFKV